ncbi:Uma2 family endonuclease [Acaryochloris sp. IP29b_bin.137]|uniref:Uma2 family endonuclease n=1 Tax=Acaryochloris sp. IP29b_bin.137 TaxID=2969217 RepID=UPI002616D17E|nr:Uma2 family endonuclease [Acaryochloris sp. IP29b_bin.137]
MVQAPAQTVSLSEFLALPETQPASEYLDGFIVQKPMPQGKHSTIQRDLTMAVERVLKPQKKGRVFPELRCTFAGRSIVPDIAIFTWERIPRDEDGSIANQFSLAPDWVVEILSPDQSQTKVTKKILFCLQHGTQLGWLIDPTEQTVFVYASEQALQVFDMDSPDRSLPVPNFASDVHLTVQDMVNWLLD